MRRTALDKLTLKMEKFRHIHKDWRTDPEWKKLCEEFVILYTDFTEARKLKEKILAL